MSSQLELGHARVENAIFIIFPPKSKAASPAFADEATLKSLYFSYISATRSGIIVKNNNTKKEKVLIYRHHCASYTQYIPHDNICGSICQL
jgi:hypothetical protein